MFNIGAGELIVILIIALIVLGPDKLPDAVRRAGQLYGELRRMSSGFQAELRDALDEPMQHVRSTTDLVKSTFTSGVDGPGDGPDDEAGDEPTPDSETSTKPTKLLTDDDQLQAVSGDRPVPLPPPGAGQVSAPLPPPPES